MKAPIVLKNFAAEDVTFSYSHSLPNGNLVYERQTGPLVGRARLVLSLSDSAVTNRVKYKLIVPQVCTGTDTCSIPTIEYTQIASGDISVFRAGTELSRKDIGAMAASLANNATVQAMIVNGSRL